MKTIIFALMMISVLASIAAPAFAGEWAKIDANGVVLQVITADFASVMDRDDGPWIKTYPKVLKVSPGFLYDPATLSFSVPELPPATPLYGAPAQLTQAQALQRIKH